VAAFDYVAVDDGGRKKKGVLEGDSARQIRANLREKGWFPLEVEPAREKNSAALFASRGPAITVSELALITRQLSTLVGSGMPLEECLRAVADQSEKAKIRSMILAVRGKVLEGHSLAQSLKEYPRAFPRLFRATVDAGEQSGHLDAVLDRLADYVEDEQATRKSIQMSAVYPIILVTIAVSIVVFLLNSVVPKILDTFINSGQELPGPTKALLATTNFFSQYWPMMILGIVGLIAFNIWWNRNTKRRRAKDRLKLSMPLFGKMILGFNTARFASTLSTLGSSGVPLVEAMQIASQVVTNLAIQQKVVEATQQVSEGTSLHVALTETGYFPPMMLHMIASGEQSGELESMLTRTAQAQERSLKELISTLLSLFEPLMLVFMGLIVMIIVMAVVLPITEMNSLVG